MAGRSGAVNWPARSGLPPRRQAVRSEIKVLSANVFTGVLDSQGVWVMTISEIITFLLSNFTLTFFFTGLIFSAVALARKPEPVTAPVVIEALFKWYLFFSIGVTYVYNAVFHVIFHETAAGFIGWADSPFQIELGFASFGMGLIGLIASWRSFDMRLAAILGPACFLWGAAPVRRHPGRGAVAQGGGQSRQYARCGR